MIEDLQFDSFHRRSNRSDLISLEMRELLNDLIGVSEMLHRLEDYPSNPSSKIIDKSNTKGHFLKLKKYINSAKILENTFVSQRKV